MPGWISPVRPAGHRRGLCASAGRWRPGARSSRWPTAGAVRTDMVYTFLTRLGLLPLLAFVLLASLQSRWEGWLTEAGLLPPTLEELVPPLRDHPAAGAGALCGDPGFRRILAAPGAARPAAGGGRCMPSTMPSAR